MTEGLSVTDLHKEYPTSSAPLVVLSGVTFCVPSGESLVIMGPSGSGKSTLLYILGSLEKPTRGTVSVNGIDPFFLNGDDLAEFRNQSVGFIFQDHLLLPQCSALENVLLPAMSARRGTGTGTVARARHLLERVGLSDRLSHRPSELSGGERQRVAIARALITRPNVILADEPTGNLDRHAAGSIADLLLDLQREEHITLLLVSHSSDLASRFHRRAELINGILHFMPEIKVPTAPDSLRKSSSSPAR